MYVGCNIYVWGQREQDRLLGECMAPLARDLRATGTCQRFFCDRFDARGPHVMALFGGAEAARGEIAARVSEAVAAYLARAPSTATPSDAELEARHAACRGAALCSVDREPGTAENNSFRVFAHAAGGYPFHLAEGAAEEDALWRLGEELVLWALGCIGAGASSAAARWMAALDEALRAAGQPAGACFGYLAGRLGLGLEERWRRGEVTTEALLAAVGAKNCEALARVWASADVHAHGGCDLVRLVELVLAEDGRPVERRRQLLYALVHGTMRLLGLLGRQEIPLVLFAWATALGREGAPAGGRP